MKKTSRKMQAMRVLHEAFTHNENFRKQFRDYLELSITGALDDAGIKSVKKIKQIRTEAATQILGMFDPVWAEMAFKND
jgi:hypothetical protein